MTKEIEEASLYLEELQRSNEAIDVDTDSRIRKLLAQEEEPSRKKTQKSNRISLA